MKINQMPGWATGLLLAFSLLTACEKDLQEKVPAQEADVISAESVGMVKKGKYKGNPITYKEIDGQAIWQGDILLTREQLGDDAGSRTEGAGLADKNGRWQNWTIPYTLSNNFTASDVKIVKEAIANWEASTPIVFVQRTNQADYVHFQPNNLDYSFSYLGRAGGKQVISLSRSIYGNTVIHEIGHAIGLLHEHSRLDRDNFVTVHWENILPEHQDQFERYVESGVDGFDFGAFDFNSIMLYGPTTGAIAGKKSMSRNDGKFWSKAEAVSGSDAQAVISMYSNVYLIRAGKLYAVDPKDGKSAFLGDGWAGAGKVLAENDDHVWGLQGGGLWKTFRMNGGYERVGTDDWTGAKGLTGQDAQGNFYAVYAGNIWKINKYGQRSMLPGSSQWADTQALYYHKNALYVVLLDKLYKVNTSTGAVEKTYNGVSWFDVRGIAAALGSSDNLYVMRKNALFRVNIVTGAITGGEKFEGVTAMTGAGGYLFIVNKYLIKMDESGNKQLLPGFWEGTESIGATRNPNLW